MENSDSECFESADEDLLDEREEVEQKSSKTSIGKGNVNIKKGTDKSSESFVKEIPDCDEVSKSQNLHSKAFSESRRVGGEEDIKQPKHKTNILNEEVVQNRKPSKGKGKKLGEKLGSKIDPSIRDIPVEKSENNPEDERIYPKLDKAELDDLSNKHKPSETKTKCKNQDEKLLEEIKPDLEDNMWENDDWETIDDTQPKQQSQGTEKCEIEDKNNEENSGWGNWGASWGNWNVPSFLNTATQGVVTLTSHVSQGLNSVLESGIGSIPDPEEMARLTLEEEKLEELEKEEKVILDESREPGSLLNFKIDGFVSGVSQITKFVESTGTKVISGGLDTLETIGKKTMEVLQEGDPGLKKKRAFLKLGDEKPVLSQLLKEAREKYEKECQYQNNVKKTKNYETLFDDYQGLVHLEALELLSKQCEIKLCTLMERSSRETLADIQETVEQVRELCELPDEEEGSQCDSASLREKLSVAVSEMKLSISYEKLVTSWEEIESKLEKENYSEEELHQQAIECLAQMTAMAVEQFHKSGELLLIKEHRSTADEADSLVQITTALTSLTSLIATKFSEYLNNKSEKTLSKEEVNSMITNIFFEAANSSTYIQDAFQLLIPVLQVGAV